MKYNPEYFNIDNIDIKWGETLDDAQQKLVGLVKYKSNERWDNIECRCNSIFELPCNMVTIRAPFNDRPVLSVSYQIQPLEIKWFEKLYSPYMRKINKFLGKADNHKDQTDFPKVEGRDYSSSIVYSSTWVINDLEISFCLFENVRKEYMGSTSGSINIIWKNEIKAAKYVNENNDSYNKKLTNYLNEDLKIIKYQLDLKQSPFFISNNYMFDNSLYEENELLRASNSKLFSKSIFVTPVNIRIHINEDEVSFTESPENGIYISNKWDTIFLKKNNLRTFIIDEILPARGSGGTEIVINDLKIMASKGSKTIYEICRMIESIVGREPKRITSYDY